MTQDNSLLAAWAISAVNNGEQMSAHLPRIAGKNILSAVKIWRLNDHRIQKNCPFLTQTSTYLCSTSSIEGHLTENRLKLVLLLLKGWRAAAGNSVTGTPIE